MECGEREWVKMGTRRGSVIARRRSRARRKMFGMIRNDWEAERRETKGRMRRGGDESEAEDGKDTTFAPSPLPPILSLLIFTAPSAQRPHQQLLRPHSRAAQNTSCNPISLQH